MNFENFRKLLDNQLLLNLKPNSVLILVNTAYHNVQEDRCPTSACRKGDTQEYIRRHEIPFGPKMLKAELLEICKRHKKAPVYIVDEILRKHGRLALRLPPYHAGLNATELIWGDVKRHIVRKNLSSKFSDTKVLIDEVLTKCQVINAYPKILIVSYLSYQFRGLLENSAVQVNQIFRHFTMSWASQSVKLPVIAIAYSYEGCPKSPWTTWITLCKHAGKAYQDHSYFAHYTDY